MPANLLSAVKCKAATCEDPAIRKLHDGAGLYLWVYPNGSNQLRHHGRLASHALSGRKRGQSRHSMFCARPSEGQES